MQEPTLDDIRLPFILFWLGVPLAALVGLCAYLVAVRGL